MKLTLALTLLPCLAALAVAASVASPPPPTTILTRARAAALVKRLAAVRQCNANICFAIDGSGSIGKKAFQLQKDFVLDVISVVATDHATEQAAVQYGTANSPITRLTADVERFNLAVDDAVQLGGLSFVTGGLNYCISQMFRRPFEANKIILLGDGMENIGSSPANRADWFRKEIGGDISVVAAGRADLKALLKIVDGKKHRVFQVENFLDVLSLQYIIEQLTLDICGVNPTVD